MEYRIENEELIVTVDSFGAEVKSVLNKKTKKEYMWCGDPVFWGRTSPVLFPIVGSVRDKKYRHQGQEYTMGQHGFARDMEFILAEQSENEVYFKLSSNRQTYEKYPFHFELVVGYRLNGSKLAVVWKVHNCDTEDMYFSIGAHPAFYYEKGDCISFDKAERIQYGLLGEDGLILPEKYELELKNSSIEMSQKLFETSALIVEDRQTTEVSLCKPDGTAYVTVRFDAPLFGVWSPEKKKAPFVCIEPWYGRCDASDFEGEFSERKYMQRLEENETFATEYEIVFA